MSSTLKPEDSFATALFEQAPLAMLRIDRAGAVQYVNSAAEQLFGYSKDTLVGKPVEILVPDGLEPRHKQHREAFFEAPAGRQMGKGRRLTARHRDGHEIHVEVGLNPVRVGSDPIVVLASFNDNSAQERAETALLVRELTHRAKILFAVISAIAHQIWKVESRCREFSA